MKKPSSTRLAWLPNRNEVIREMAPLKSPISWRAAGEVASNFTAIILSWFISVHVGNWLSDKILRHELKSAISVMSIMRAVGRPGVNAFYHFARQHKLSVYRATKEMGAEEKDMPCRRIPLFGTWLYSPIPRRQFFADNLLYLDKDEVQLVLAEMAHAFAHDWPEIINEAVNAEQEKRLRALQERLDEVNSKLGDRNRLEGPYAASAKHRLFIIAQLFSCLPFMSVFKTGGFRKQRITKDQIDTEYGAFMQDRETLGRLLVLLKPDANSAVLHPDVMALLRLAIKQGAAPWGEPANSSLLKLLRNIMNDAENVAFDDERGWSGK